MGASFSTEKGWNEAEESVRLWKADMLTMVNVAKFLVKAVRAQDILNARVQARVMATKKANGWSIFPSWNIWTKIADAVTTRGIGEVHEDFIRMTATTIPKRVQNMYEAVTKAVKTTQQWVTDVIVEMETTQNLDSSLREAIKKKAKEVFDTCGRAQALFRNAWEKKLCCCNYTKQYGYPGNRDHDQRPDNDTRVCNDVPIFWLGSRSDNKAIAIKFVRYLISSSECSPDPPSCPYPPSSTYTCYDSSEGNDGYGHSRTRWKRRYPGFNGQMSVSHLDISLLPSATSCSDNDAIVIGIEDTAPFLEVGDSPLCSNLYNVVSGLKCMVMELTHDLRTLHANAHMSTKG
jgi:hypothetical protein